MRRIRSGFLVAAVAAGVAVPAAHADVCPAITLDPQAKKTVSYPGGDPGRRPQDFAYIAVILSAEAVCSTDDDDRVIAQITVTYAVEAGTLYRGAAQVTVEASVRGPTAGSGKATKKVSPPAEGGSITVTDTIANVVAGDEDAVEDGLVTISVGFAKAQ